MCNYRCIASYQSPYLETFSLSVLQKHNCLQLDAKILKKPYVAPMASFRIVTCVMRLLKISLLVGWEIWIGVGVSWQDKILHMINFLASTNYSTGERLKVHFGMRRFSKSKPWMDESCRGGGDTE